MGKQGTVQSQLIDFKFFWMKFDTSQCCCCNNIFGYKWLFLYIFSASFVDEGVRLYNVANVW